VPLKREQNIGIDWPFVCEKSVMRFAGLAAAAAAAAAASSSKHQQL
jgi:hypothetical protein